MKGILFFLSLTCFVSAGAQTKMVNISEIKIGPDIKATLDKFINVAKKDTSLYLGISFQDADYEHIVNIKVIGFSITKDSSEVNKFIEDLKSASNEIGAKSSMSFDTDKYRLMVFDSSSEVHLYQPRKKGEGHTTLTKKQIEKLLDWLQKNGFKS